MASLMASGFGPILAYALSLIRVGKGTYARGWRWIFIIEGIITIVCGMAAPWLLVDCKNCSSSPSQRYQKTDYESNLQSPREQHGLRPARSTLLKPGYRKTRPLKSLYILPFSRRSRSHWTGSFLFSTFLRFSSAPLQMLGHTLY